MLVTFASNYNSSATEKQLQNACLVISPIGLALSQADLCGQLRWKEIRGVRLGRNKPFVATRGAINGPAIMVQVDGAVIPIADINDASLDTIHDRISHKRGGN